MLLSWDCVGPIDAGWFVSLVVWFSGLALFDAFGSVSSCCVDFG